MTSCEACTKALKDLKIVATLLHMALAYDDGYEELAEAHDRVVRLIAHLERHT